MSRNFQVKRIQLKSDYIPVQSVQCRTDKIATFAKRIIPIKKLTQTNVLLMIYFWLFVNTCAIIASVHFAHGTTATPLVLISSIHVFPLLLIKS